MHPYPQYPNQCPPPPHPAYPAAAQQPPMQPVQPVQQQQPPVPPTAAWQNTPASYPSQCAPVPVMNPGYDVHVQCPPMAPAQTPYQKPASPTAAIVFSTISLVLSAVLFFMWVFMSIYDAPSSTSISEALGYVMWGFVQMLACSSVAVGCAIGAMISSAITKRAWPLSIASLFIALGPWATIALFMMIPW